MRGNVKEIPKMIYWLKSNRWIIILFVSIFLFAVFLSVFVLVVFSRFSSSEEEGNEVEFFKYKVRSINPKKEHISKGFVSMKEKLEEHEFIFDKSENGMFILISNFGNDEYQCSGTCFCEDSESNKRRSTTSISKGVYYLLVAVSSLIAYNKAKEYFEQECQRDMLDECSQTQIRSSVDKCEKDSDFETDNGNRDVRLYYCRGVCLPSKKIKSKEVQKLADDFDCQELSHESEVQVDCTNVAKGHCESLGAIKYQESFLTPYCHDHSLTRFQYWIDDVPDPLFMTQSVCVGSHLVERNPSVACIQTYPEFCMKEWEKRVGGELN